MKKICLHIVWLLLALPSANGGDEPESLSPPAQSDFEWFSRLGFPDVKGCPFVRVATGSWSRTGNEPPCNQYLNTFLLTSTDTNFATFSVDLFQRTFNSTTNGMPEHQRVGFEPLDLKVEAAAFLQRLAQLKEGEDLFDRLGEQISKRSYTFIFAWGCWRNGLNAEAEKLYRLSKTLRYGIEEIDEDNFQHTLEQEISHAIMWRAVMDFGRTSISRPELLAKFQAFVANYPNSEYQERAKQTVEMLTRMIAEDVAHANAVPTNHVLQPIEDRVHELIFRLRDQHGEQHGQPDWCDIFNDFHGTTNTPAHELVSIGYPAVPQLIAALEDPTFTRSVGYWRDFTFSHNVLTVGDCAMQILGRITGKYFYMPTHTAGYMSADKKAEEAHRLAVEWWAEFQTKGERRMLIEGVAAGSGSAVAQAAMLKERFPDSLISASIQAARASTNRRITQYFIQTIESNPSPEAQAFMKNILREGTAVCKATAAQMLVRGNRIETISAMIQEWDRHTNAVPPFDFESSLPIAHFLAAMDSPDAIAALKHNLDMRPASIKNAVINEVAGCTSSSDFCMFNNIREGSASENALVEEFLISFLPDKSPLELRLHDYYWKSRPGMRICDEAAYYLNQLWPKRYAFYVDTTLIGQVEKTVRDHDRQIAAILAVWKQAQPEK